MRGAAPFRPLRAALAALPAWCLLALPSATAHGYYELSRLSSDDVRVVVDSSGVAAVTHRLGWKVIAGQPRSFEIAGVEPGAELSETALLSDEGGRTFNGALARAHDDTVRVTVLDPKAVHHGQTYTVTIEYRVDLVNAHELERDGSAYSLVWKGATLPTGYDEAKVTFVLPAAPEAPTAFIGQGGMADDGTLATVKRLADTDEVSLMRPHVGAKESSTWAVHVSAKAFVHKPRGGLPPPPAPPKVDELSSVAPFVHLLVALLSIAFAAAVRWCSRLPRRPGAADGPPPRGFLPLPAWERAALAGTLLFAGVSIELSGAPVTGALVVSGALLCAALRSPRRPRPLRTGRWTALHPTEAFATSRARPRRVLDLAARAGGLALAVSAFAAVGEAVSKTHPEARALFLLDAVVVLPLLWPMSRGGDRTRALTSVALHRLYVDLTARADLPVTTVGHVSGRGRLPDEVRLQVRPEAAMPGLVAVEVGFVAHPIGSLDVAVPEVLVRALESSPALSRARKRFPDASVTAGRTSEERILRILPPLPTRDATRAVVFSLVTAVTERRESVSRYAGVDRRTVVSEPAPEVMLGMPLSA